MTEMIFHPLGAVARPLADLVQLIHKQMRLAHDAAEPHWLAVGQLLHEAKAQLAHGEFGPWCERHFNISATQRARYMKAAGATVANQNFRTGKSSLEDHLRGTSYATGTKTRTGQGGVNLDAIRQDEIKRSEDRDLKYKLARELINRGYKALAAELHPDKGGSPEAMARLNEVRAVLKRCTTGIAVFGGSA
jgi:hypothetical protein